MARHVGLRFRYELNCFGCLAFVRLLFDFFRRRRDVVIGTLASFESFELFEVPHRLSRVLVEVVVAILRLAEVDFPPLFAQRGVERRLRRHLRLRMRLIQTTSLPYTSLLQLTVLYSAFFLSMATFVSTRQNRGPAATWNDVLLCGYAPDGGLFVPASVPAIPLETLKTWKNLSHPEICKKILRCYFTEDELPHATFEGEQKATESIEKLLNFSS